MQNQKELRTHTIVLMIIVALFFDVLQALLTFIFMGWLVGFFAGLTFYVWLKFYGISFMTPKRFVAFGGSFIIEMIPYLSILPAWTFCVSYLALSSRLHTVAPTIGTPKSDIIKG